MPLLAQMLPLLDKGDILSHFYTWKVGGVIKPDGNPIPEFKEAIKRGVALDTAIGRSHWSYDIARKGIEHGILPTTLSTDLSIKSIGGPVYGLLATMSKFIAAGLKLEQTIEMTTINPARLMGEEGQRGKLGIGMPADVSILEPSEGDFLFTDGHVGTSFKGKLLLLPKLTLKNGVAIAPSPSARGLGRVFQA